MDNRISCAVGTVLALMLATQGAHAGPKDEDLKARREEAVRFHMEGLSLLSQSNFEAARAKFHEAYARSQNPNSLFNEAKSALKAGHGLDGAKLVKSYLALPENDKVTAQDRKDAQSLLDEAMGSLCTLDVRVATCNVDGRDEAGSVLVEVGNHTVKMTGAHGEQTKAVSCKAREIVIVTYDEQRLVTPPPTDKTQGGDWLLPGVLAGLGVVGIGVGAVGSALASGSSSDTKTLSVGAPCAADANGEACRGVGAAADRTNAQSSVALTGWIVGGGLLGAALITTLVIRPWKERPAAHVRLVPAPMGALLTGTF